MTLIDEEGRPPPSGNAEENENYKNQINSGERTIPGTAEPLPPTVKEKNAVTSVMSITEGSAAIIAQ